MGVRLLHDLDVSACRLAPRSAMLRSCAAADWGHRLNDLEMDLHAFDFDHEMPWGVSATGSRSAADLQPRAVETMRTCRPYATAPLREASKGIYQPVWMVLGAHIGSKMLWNVQDSFN